MDRMGKIADISKWQGNVNWPEAAKELDFVILRASCGTSEDTKYERNVDACIENGIPFGAYHYVKAGDADAARAEAEAFLKVTASKNRRPAFYIADIEYEAQTKTTTEAVCVAFLQTLRDHCCEKIGLYINTRYNWAGKAIDMCDIMWIPHWGKNDGEVPADSYKSSHPHDLWQYTSKGSLAGVSGNVDLNQLTGTKPMSYFIGSGQNGVIKPEEEKPMSYDPKKVIQVALGEVGYLEKKSNANLDDKTANAGDKNYTKYARDLDALGFYNGKKQSVAWCDIFVDWCFVQAYGLEAALKLTNQPLGKSNCGAGCKYSRNYYKNKKQLFDKPQPGDQVFFWPKDGIGGSAIQHTGLVYDVDGTYVYTVEGNTSGANGVVANGGGVCKKKYKLTYERLAGFGRPDYGTAVVETPVAVPEKPVTVEPDFAAGTKVVTITANSLNARVGDSQKYDSVGYVNKGDKFEWIATSPATGWHAIRMAKRICWVSPNYSKVEVA